MAQAVLRLLEGEVVLLHLLEGEVTLLHLLSSLHLRHSSWYRIQLQQVQVASCHHQVKEQALEEEEVTQASLMGLGLGLAASLLLMWGSAAQGLVLAQ